MIPPSSHLDSLVKFLDIHVVHVSTFANDIIMYWPFHWLDHIHNNEDHINSQNFTCISFVSDIFRPKYCFCSQAFLYSRLSIKFLHGGNLAICGGWGGDNTIQCGSKINLDVLNYSLFFVQISTFNTYIKVHQINLQKATPTR
jgi:hypothetical protein